MTKRLPPLAAVVIAVLGCAAHAQTPAAPPAAAAAAPAAASAAADTAKGLTAVGGIKVGHFTLTERPTGCTVILTEAGAVAGVDVRGGAPGTRETDLLNPANTVQKVHAIVLAGGSAFGLDSATGVMRYLEEKNVGFDVGIARVPIVPAAILFDLGFGGAAKPRPDAECGYKAAAAASDAAVAEGSIGAGAGATVGKMGGPASMTKSGIGSAALAQPDGLVVAAIVAVNAVGDIVDPATGKVVAGVRTPDGKSFADVRQLLRSGAFADRSRKGENTTIGVVATNAALTKAQATKVAQMAHDGYARTISPVHTPFDGDAIFALATGVRAGEVTDVQLSRIGALAAEAMADAVLRAARQATTTAGVPAARDLAKP